MKTMTAKQLKNDILNGIPYFNERITVIDQLDFSRKIDKKIKALPDNLIIDNLILGNSNIILLPELLAVKHLNLRNSKIVSLPRMITIGELYLQNSKLTSLPENLSVQILYLIDSQIRNIPATLKNIKVIYVDKTFLPSISDSSFSICVNLFRNIIKELSTESDEFVNKQFEERLQKNK